MRLIKHIWISQERVETGLGAKVDRFSAIFGTREIGRVRVDDTSAKSDEAR